MPPPPPSGSLPTARPQAAVGWLLSRHTSLSATGDGPGWRNLRQALEENGETVREAFPVRHAAVLARLDLELMLQRQWSRWISPPSGAGSARRQWRAVAARCALVALCLCACRRGGLAYVCIGHNRVVLRRVMAYYTPTPAA